MYTPLSVLLCVRNAQATLAATVHQFLEVLSEVAECWELIVLDDGSIDATVEVADELSTHYPQIRVLSRSASFGSARLVKAGLKASRGAVLLISDGQRIPAPDQLATACRTFDWTAASCSISTMTANCIILWTLRPTSSRC